MPCENCREALIEAAAADSVPSTELRSHLDACASCHAAFAEELQLFSAIDLGLRTTANAEVPPSFLPRVAARLENAPASQRGWTPFLIFAAASAAIVLTVFIAARPRHTVNDSQAKQISSAPSREMAETTVRREATGTPVIVAPKGSHHMLQRPNPSLTRTTSSTRLEVIVPADEREAFARFIATRQERNSEALTLVTPAPEKKDDPMSVAPLQIAVLEVRRLEGLESEAPDSTQENQE
jgi:hypothetical protein